MTHLACGWQRELNCKITSVIFTPLHNPSAYCWPSTIHILNAKISRVFSKVHVRALTVTLWFLLFNSTLFFLIFLPHPSTSVLLILQLQKLGSLLVMYFDDRFQQGMCYCIVISFTSIFEKHPTTLSDHRSCKTCPKDESNAQEAIRLFCITNKKTSAFKSFYCS